MFNGPWFTGMYECEHCGACWAISWMFEDKTKIKCRACGKFMKNPYKKKSK